MAVGRIRDADRTRKRILDAARREFGTHGLHGARVDAIAKRARVNKGLIFYYFQSKEELFRVLSEQRIASTLPTHDWKERGQPFDWPRALFATEQETRDWVRYFFWEGITLDAARADSLPQVELRREAFRQVVDEVRRQQERGTLPERLDARQLTFFLYVLGVYPYLLPQMAYLITGEVPETREFRTEFETFVRDLARLFETPARPSTSSG